MADFVKGKSTDNPKFLKSGPAEPEKPANGECRKLRGLPPVNDNCSDKAAATTPLGFLESIKCTLAKLFRCKGSDIS